MDVGGWTDGCSVSVTSNSFPCLAGDVPTVGPTAIVQLLILGHQDCLAAREKNQCSLALKSGPRLNPSPSISSRIRATFKEKPLLLSCSGPQRLK